MKTLFVDTSHFLAVANARDTYHHRAVELSASLEARFVTTAWVLLEFANSVCATHSRHRFAQTLGQLQADPSFEIVPPSSELFDRGCRLYMDRPDKEWSLTDCISILGMEERRLTEALTSDHHFEQAGFNALLLS